MNLSLSEENLFNMTGITFSWYDYIFFTATLFLSTLIGVYFGCFGSRQFTTYEYLMANKAMKPLPIALSLIAGHVSGATFITIPLNTYRFGAYYFLDSISIILQSILHACIYLPVYFNVEITSIYEYLEKRFDRKARLLASFLYLLSAILYLPIVIHTAVLTCSIATGLNMHLLIFVLCSVCIVYTSISGLKGVIWTDTLQFIIMTGTITFVFILSLKFSGGLSIVWNKAVDGQRLDIFDLDFDPTIRMSVWSFVFGNSVIRLALNSVSQSATQKYLTLPTFRDAIYAVIFYTIGMSIVSVGNVFFGLAMYAKYADCDPITAKTVSKSDQLAPYFVLDVASKIPGVPGLYVAGIVSAALSTLSVGWNAMAGTIYMDFLKKHLNRNISEKTGTNILKLLVVLEGVLCICAVYIIQQFDEILPLLLSFTSLTLGPILGIFSLGVLFPKVNSKGAFYGTLIGFIFSASIIFPSTYFQLLGWIRYSPKPVSVERCQFLNNTVSSQKTIVYVHMCFYTTLYVVFMIFFRHSPSVSSVFKISFMYHGLIGTIVTIVVGFIISCITKGNKEPIDRCLISPLTSFLLPHYKKAKMEEENNDVIN